MIKNLQKYGEIEAENTTSIKIPPITSDDLYTPLVQQRQGDKNNSAQILLEKYYLNEKVEYDEAVRNKIFFIAKNSLNDKGLEQVVGAADEGEGAGLKAIAK